MGFWLTMQKAIRSIDTKSHLKPILESNNNNILCVFFLFNLNSHRDQREMKHTHQRPDSTLKPALFLFLLFLHPLFISLSLPCPPRFTCTHYVTAPDFCSTWKAEHREESPQVLPWVAGHENKGSANINTAPSGQRRHRGASEKQDMIWEHVRFIQWYNEVKSKRMEKFTVKCKKKLYWLWI